MIEPYTGGALLKMRGIPFAKRYLSPIGAAKGTPSRAKAKSPPAVITERAAKENWEAEGGNVAEPAKKRAG